MACCGQKRAALVRSAPARANIQAYTRPAAHALAQPNSTEAVSLRYLGTTALALRGAHSGQTYYVENDTTVIAVQKQDVETLLSSQLFVREAT